MDGAWSSETLATGISAPFRASWTWREDDDGGPAGDAQHPPRLADLTERVLHVTARHGLLMAESLRWLARDRRYPASGVSGTIWPPAGYARLVPDLAGQLARRLAELDPAPTAAETLTAAGPTIVLQPGDMSCAVPGGCLLHVDGSAEAVTVTLQTRLDVWMPRNRFGHPQPELHELNAPRLAACLAEIGTELGWKLEPGRDQGPYARPARTGLDNGAFYDGSHLLSPPATEFTAAVPSGSPLGRLLAAAPRSRPVPWSAEALDGWAHWLRDQLLRAAGALPGASPRAEDPVVSAPDSVIRPGEYAQMETVVTDRGVLSPGEAVRLAGGWLAGNGWELGPYADGDHRVGVAATRLGCAVTVAAWPTAAEVSLTGTTRPVRVYPRVQWERPERAVTPETVEPGQVLCYECDGWGSCPVCEGTGWLPGRRRCTNCHIVSDDPTGICPICRGAGQLSINRLSPYQRKSYPGLPGGSADR